MMMDSKLYFGALILVAFAQVEGQLPPPPPRFGANGQILPPPPFGFRPPPPRQNLGVSGSNVATNNNGQTGNGAVFLPYPNNNQNGNVYPSQPNNNNNNFRPFPGVNNNQNTNNGNNNNNINGRTQMGGLPLGSPRCEINSNGTVSKCMLDNNLVTIQGEVLDAPGQRACTSPEPRMAPTLTLEQLKAEARRIFGSPSILCKEEQGGMFGGPPPGMGGMGGPPPFGMGPPPGQQQFGQQYGQQQQQQYGQQYGQQQPAQTYSFGGRRKKRQMPQPFGGGPGGRPRFPDCKPNEDKLGRCNNVTHSIQSLYARFSWDAKFDIVVTNGIPKHCYNQNEVSPTPNAACEHYRVMKVLKDGQNKYFDRVTFDELPMGPVGIALSGAFIYNHLSGEPSCRVAALTEKPTFDPCDGHSDPACRYHYHKAPVCITGYNNCGLMGHLSDGYPVYGKCKVRMNGRVVNLASCYRTRDTSKPYSCEPSEYLFDETKKSLGNCQLDKANGFHFTSDAVDVNTNRVLFKANTYAYFFTPDYPFAMPSIQKFNTPISLDYNTKQGLCVVDPNTVVSGKKK